MDSAHIDPIDRIRDWLYEKKPELGEIPEEGNLINEGYLDSLQFVNFLLFIEHTRKTPIPEEMIIPEAFQTLTVIRKNFFPSVDAPQRG